MTAASNGPWIKIGAALGVLVGLAARADAQVQIRFGDNRAGTSIRFGDPPAPRYVPVPVPVPVPVVPPGSVRHDYHHHHDHDYYRRYDYDRSRYGRSVWGDSHPTYYSPYSAAYIQRFRPGYRPVVVGTSQYYIYSSIPPNSQSVVVNGVAYYHSDGVYYQPRLYEGHTVYMVVPSPIP